MIEPPMPDDEQARMAALLELCILDTPAEERFDRITRTARELFQVPIALVSLVDAKRLWFKSRTGFEVNEMPRATSFCGHAILGTNALIVENALADPRFADNPLVTGHPGIRLYAGMPLRAITGRSLGTLCLIDYLPRRFGAADALRLRDLAAWAEQELNRSVEIQAAITEIRDTFVRLVGHEFRTPAPSMVGALELIRGGIVAKGNIESLARMAVDEAGQLRRLAGDIVEIAELDAGQRVLTPSSIELPLFIQAAMESCAASARRAGVVMTMEVPQDMVVHAVVKQFGRILRVLLGNALRFSPPDTNVTVAATQANRDMVRISVTDQGPGIPAEYIPRLFQALVQVDTGDGRSHGSGISLTICHRFAAAMGGRLGYEPAEGGGSRFFLDLPA